MNYFKNINKYINKQFVNVYYIFYIFYFYSAPKENYEVLENKQLSLNFNQDYDLCEQYSPRDTPTDNNEILDTPKRKITPQKFILPIEVENSTSTEGKMKEKLIDVKQENEKLRIEKLKKEKRDIMCVMVTIKRKIADIEIQEDELLREVRNNYFNVIYPQKIE